MAQRIKGQEVELQFVVNNVPQQSVFDIRSFEVTLQQEIMSEGYLGESTNRRDSIFNGVAGSIEANIENNEFVGFITSVIDKARRRTPGTKINVRATLNFPNGQRVRAFIPDIEIGELPLNFASRSDYGTITVPFEAANMTLLT